MSYLHSMSIKDEIISGISKVQHYIECKV